LDRLRVVGRFLEETNEDDDEIEHALSPIRDLSATARSLGCTISFREATGTKAVLARVEATSYDKIAKALLVTGETSFMGNVQRVGGATDVRCGLRVAFQNRMLICRVGSKEVARAIGNHLYEDVVVQGTAHWLKNTWRIVSFTISGVVQPRQGSI